MPEKESTIQRQILNYLNSLPSCKAYNMHGNAWQGAGRPDIIACYKGQFLAWEIKTEIGEPTRLQIHELAKWQEAGAFTTVIRSLDQAKRVIRIVEGIVGHG